MNFLTKVNQLRFNYLVATAILLLTINQILFFIK